MDASFAFLASVGSTWVSVHARIGSSLALTSKAAIVGGTVQSVIAHPAVTFAPIQARNRGHTRQAGVFWVLLSIGNAGAENETPVTCLKRSIAAAFSVTDVECAF